MPPITEPSILARIFGWCKVSSLLPVLVALGILGIAPDLVRVRFSNLFFVTVLHWGIADSRLDELALSAPLSPTRLAWQLGAQAQARGEYARAIGILERGLASDLGHPLVRYWLGSAYYESGDYVAAITQWESIRASAVLFAKGDEAQKAARFTEAILFLESLLRVDPNFPHAHYLMAYAYLGPEVPENAIREAQEAIRLDHGRNLGYRSMLAWIYENTGYSDLAYEEYATVLAIAPDNASAREGLARLQKAREEKRK